MDKKDIRSLSLDELKIEMESIGEKAFRAKQVYEWLHTKLADSFEEMTNLSKGLREKLDGAYRIPSVKMLERQVSSLDGTNKFLFQLEDGNVVESVLMRYKHGNSVCISSQVGCRMGCKFCASTIGGKVRDLYPSELLGQILTAERDSGERISNIVMMGIGEPLDNYANVIRFLKLVGNEDGLNIGYRHISLSTCGIVEKIDALAKESFPITLSISLHASNDETRSSIMPINKKWNIDALLDACYRYYETTKRRISFEYTLISRKNDSEASALELAELLNRKLRPKRTNEPFPIHVNLIPVNPVAETEFSASDKAAVQKFAATLERKGIRATIRRRLGSDINASCGQLRREKS